MHQTKKLIELLESFLTVSQNILNKNFYNDTQPEYYLFLKVFERFAVNIDSVKILLFDIENNITREVPIKLILRASLLDFIIINYLANLISKIKIEGDENEKKYLEELDKVLCEQAKYDFNTLKLLFENNIITENNYKDKVHEIFNVFHLYVNGEIDFNNPLKNLKYSKFSSVTEKFKKSCKNDLTKKFANVYPLYQKFSKYEHIGLMTQYYQSEDVLQILSDIIFAIKICVKGSIFCTHMINYDESEFESLQQIESELQKI